MLNATSVKRKVTTASVIFVFHFIGLSNPFRSGRLTLLLISCYTIQRLKDWFMLLSIYLFVTSELVEIDTKLKAECPGFCSKFCPKPSLWPWTNHLTACIKRGYPKWAFEFIHSTSTECLSLCITVGDSVMQHPPSSKVTLFWFPENHCHAKLHGDGFSETQGLMVKALFVRDSRHDGRHLDGEVSGWGREKKVGISEDDCRLHSQGWLSPNKCRLCRKGNSDVHIQVWKKNRNAEWRCQSRWRRASQEASRRVPTPRDHLEQGDRLQFTCLQ